MTSVRQCQIGLEDLHCFVQQMRDDRGNRPYDLRHHDPLAVLHNVERQSDAHFVDDFELANAAGVDVRDQSLLDQRSSLVEKLHSALHCLSSQTSQPAPGPTATASTYRQALSAYRCRRTNSGDNASGRLTYSKPGRAGPAA